MAKRRFMGGGRGKTPWLAIGAGVAVLAYFFMKKGKGGDVSTASITTAAAQPPPQQPQDQGLIDVGAQSLPASQYPQQYPYGAGGGPGTLCPAGYIQSAYGCTPVGAVSGAPTYPGTYPGQTAATATGAYTWNGYTWSLTTPSPTSGAPSQPGAFAGQTMVTSSGTFTWNGAQWILTSPAPGTTPQATCPSGYSLDPTGTQCIAQSPVPTPITPTPQPYPYPVSGPVSGVLPKSIAAAKKAYGRSAYSCPVGGGARVHENQANTYCSKQGMLAKVASCSPFSWYCDPSEPMTPLRGTAKPPPGQVGSGGMAPAPCPAGMVMGASGYCVSALGAAYSLPASGCGPGMIRNSITGQCAPQAYQIPAA